MCQNFMSRILLLALIFSSISSKGSEFNTVYNATKAIVADRTFSNEDGIKLIFGKLELLSDTRANLQVTFKTREGQEASYNELFYSSAAQQTQMDQSGGQQWIGRYIASVEPTFHVLRIRPLDDAESGFICRECLYDKSKGLSICYIKIKTNGEVLVSVFKEEK